jgi:BASS family bile acid:Na+ symporter
VHASIVTTVLLPLALGIIMLGLGLGLTLADFKRILVVPKAIAVGLVCQMLILPLVCFGLVKAFDLPAELGVGLMLLAASPGGATANLYSHLAKGDVALNITLTAVNSVLSVVTLPLIVNLSLSQLAADTTVVPIQFEKALQIAIVLIPVAIGMVIHARAPTFAARLGKPVKILSAVFLLLIVIAAVLRDREVLAANLSTVGGAAIAFNLASLAIGYLVPRLVRLSNREAIAIGMEIGIHNGTLAIAVATTILGRPTMAIPAAIYSVVMFFTAGAFGAWVSRSVRD